MAKISMNANRKEFVTCAFDVLGTDLTVINRDSIYQVLDAYDDLKFPAWQVSKELNTGERGEYYVPSLDGEFSKDAASNVEQMTVTKIDAPVPPVMMAPSAIGVMDNQDSYVPEKFDGYVSWGNFNTVKDVVKSEIFYPLFITGLSGNGKTLLVKEVCAKLKREFIRANITIETDEDDLIGGFRLLNGETVWHDGPVVTAMKRGAILLLDEIDLASNKIMALQPVLEGSSIYLKKIGKWVHPTKGFNVIATANTKGQGSDDGRFIGTNVLNEAFLERFPVTIEQSYPTSKMEEKILTADIAREQSVRAAEITRDRELKAAEIANELNVEVANQDRQIALAKKSQETNKARALADLTMADAVKASEQISTVKRLSEAERRKELALMAAVQKAEIAGTHMRIQAKAEQETAGAKAAAALELAKGDAAAQNVRSAAKKPEMLAEADGTRALNEAENTISDRLVVMRMNRNRLEALPKIVAEMVKPAEKIESIKIPHVTGLGARPSAGGGDGSGDGGGAGGGKSVINQAIDSILDMAVQMPALKKIGEEIGFTVDGSIAGAVEGMLEASEKGKPDTGGH